MPLSTVLGAQSLIKPGVCTTATRPSAPFVGQLIYDTTLSQTLAYNGSAWVVQSAGMVLVTSGSFTLATSVSLPTSTFSSTYRNYKVIFDVTATTARSALTLRFRASGTDDSGANYHQAANGYDSQGSAANLAQASATSLTVATNYATEPIVVNLDIFNPQRTAITWGTGFYTSDSSAGANIQTRATSFKYGATTSFDSMSLISSVASSMTGVYRVYGYGDS